MRGFAGLLYLVLSAGLDSGGPAVTDAKALRRLSLGHAAANASAGPTAVALVDQSAVASDAQASKGIASFLGGMAMTIAKALLEAAIYLMIFFLILKCTTDSGQTKRIEGIASDQDSINSTVAVSGEVLDLTNKQLITDIHSLDTVSRRGNHIRGYEKTKFDKWEHDHAIVVNRMHETNMQEVDANLYYAARRQFLTAGKEYNLQKKRWQAVGEKAQNVIRKMNNQMVQYSKALLQHLDGSLFEVDRSMRNQDASMENSAIAWCKQIYNMMKSDLGLTNVEWQYWMKNYNDIWAAEETARKVINSIDRQREETSNNIDHYMRSMDAAITEQRNEIAQSFTQQQGGTNVKADLPKFFKRFRRKAKEQGLQFDAPEEEKEEVIPMKQQLMDKEDEMLAIHTNLTKGIKGDVMVPKDTVLNDKINELETKLKMGVGMVFAKFESAWGPALDMQLNHMRKADEKSTGQFRSKVDLADIKEQQMTDKMNAFAKLMPDEIMALENELSGAVETTYDNFDKERKKLKQETGDIEAEVAENQKVSLTDMKKARGVFTIEEKMRIAKDLINWLRKYVGKTKDTINDGRQEDQDTDREYLQARPGMERSAQRAQNEAIELENKWVKDRASAYDVVAGVPLLSNNAVENAQGATKELEGIQEEMKEDQATAKQQQVEAAKMFSEDLDDKWWKVLSRQQKEMIKLVMKIEYFDKDALHKTENLSEGDYKLKKKMVSNREMLDQLSTAAQLLQSDLSKRRNAMSSSQQKTAEMMNKQLGDLYPVVAKQARSQLQGADDAIHQSMATEFSSHDAALDAARDGVDALKETARSKLGEAGLTVDRINRKLEVQRTQLTEYGERADAEIKETLEAAQKLNASTAEQPAELKTYVEKQAQRAQQSFEIKMNGMALGDKAQKASDDALSQVSRAIDLVPAVPPPQDVSAVMDMVKQAGIVAENLKGSTAGAAKDMQRLMQHLRDMVSTSESYSESDKEHILAALDPALTALVRSSMVDTSAKEVDALAASASDGARAAMRQMDQDTAAARLDAGAAEQQVGAESGAAMVKELALAAALEQGSKREVQAKEKENQEAARVASKMLAQAQEMQVRCIGEQDKVLGSYSSMNDDLLKLQRYSVHMTVGKHERDRAKNELLKQAKGEADDFTDAGGRLGEEVSGLKHALGRLSDDQQDHAAVFAKATADAQAHLFAAAGLDKHGLAEGEEYVSELMALLTDKDKAMLQRSSDKVGAVVDALADSAKTLPFLSKVVERQDDVQKKLRHHVQFLQNLIKGQQANVVGELDKVTTSQDMEGLAANQQVRNAEIKAESDVPQDQTLPDVDQSENLEDVTTALIAGAGQQANAAKQFMQESEEKGEEQVQAFLSAAGMRHDELEAIAKKQGQDALAMVEQTRERAAQRIADGKERGVSAAALYMTLDTDATKTADKLAQLNETLFDITPPLTLDRKYDEAMQSMRDLQMAISSMPKAKSSKYSVGALIAASENADEKQEEKLEHGEVELEALEATAEATTKKD